MVFDLEMIKKLYELYPQKVEAARTLLKKPLTLSEKILYTHLWNGEAKEVYDVCIEELEDFLKGCRIVESDDEEQLIFNIDDLALEPSVD